jgi:hypothetical protein|eukprot:CAMPEP_0177761484 /NCGR_PEP_ID=MMETSP0491_2-20121128/5829_1 /TAXON_ID=63592 /ORGANISM="Tetraselmis chuii, Strain PLY429" /LENGTH=91 /DNA_ID=CAMNT_0019277461 /DNA_START=670 /DNA_END=945 /DNA_ORIENTATION=+
MVVDITVTNSARTNSNVTAAGGPLALPGGLAIGAQQSNLDALHLHAVHSDCTLLSLLEDGGRLAPMATMLVDRLETLVAMTFFKVGRGGLQ